jgi:DNA-binding NarL/FixJ family response regulator
MAGFIAAGFEKCETYSVVAKTASVFDHNDALLELAPDVVLIDMDSLRRSDAMTAALAIRKENKALTIIFMSERDNPALAKEGLLAALYEHSYWLNKPFREPKIVLGEIERAISKGISVDETLLETIVNEAAYHGLLSPQQHRVMRLMTNGLSNAAIARQCGLTEKAVERTIATASNLLNVEPASPDTNRRVNAVMTYLRAMSFI